MKLKEFMLTLETWAPLAFQEDYDNSGLIIGDPEQVINRILICLDVSPDVIDEALEKQCNLIISHHPLIFQGIKRITTIQPSSEMIVTLIKNNIAVYAMHTNLDNSFDGINALLGKKIGLSGMKILSPKTGLLRKLVTFCPVGYAEKIREVLFYAGAGHIGKYDRCSFNCDGTGSFRAASDANPFVGKKGEIHYENETRIEVIYPVYLESTIVEALLTNHPYEEVAYDIYPVNNKFSQSGSGLIGYLESDENEKDFLDRIKTIFQLPVLRHSGLLAKPIRSVAVCSGSGIFLMPEAKRERANVFLTGDIRYHDFQQGDNKLLIADIGHFESEQFIKELIHSKLNEKFPNFGVLISESEKNPVKYI